MKPTWSRRVRTQSTCFTSRFQQHRYIFLSRINAKLLRKTICIHSLKGHKAETRHPAHRRTHTQTDTALITNFLFSPYNFKVVAFPLGLSAEVNGLFDSSVQRERHGWATLKSSKIDEALKKCLKKMPVQVRLG